jgi:hypothetical protein
MLKWSCISSYSLIKVETLMSTARFWTLDIDLEGQIYDNVAWDLPGFRRSHRSVKQPRRSGRRGGRSAASLKHPITHKSV